MSIAKTVFLASGILLLRDKLHIEGWGLDQWLFVACGISGLILLERASTAFRRLEQIAGARNAEPTPQPPVPQPSPDPIGTGDDTDRWRRPS